VLIGTRMRQSASQYAMSHEGNWPTSRSIVKYCDERDTEEKEVILQLQRLSDEMKATDQVPTDLRERFVAIWPKFRPMWPLIPRSSKYSAFRNIG